MVNEGVVLRAIFHARLRAKESGQTGRLRGSACRVFFILRSTIRDSLDSVESLNRFSEVLSSVLTLQRSGSNVDYSTSTFRL